MKEPRIAVYPGSFDPPTLGHLLLILKAANIFDKVYVMIGVNPQKPNNFLSPEIRKDLLEKSISSCLHGIHNIEVEIYTGATVLFCVEHSATNIVRSFRSVTDFEYERSVASVNLKLKPDIQTVFFHLPDEASCISSSTVRELYNLGLLYDLRKFVPDEVAELLINKHHSS
jgi:pantetheine-phosphate adenylyltransferase